MQVIKAIAAGLISLFAVATAQAQQTQVKVKTTTTTPTTTQKKVVVRKKATYPKAEVTVTKSHSGYRYDRGTRRYYRVTEGRKVYYHQGWMPPR